MAASSGRLPRGEGEFSRVAERGQESRLSCQLDGFEDLAATQAACADPNAFWLTIDQCPDWLKVGFEGPLGPVIGVADVVAGLAAFATKIACKCHGYTPSPKLFESTQDYEFQKVPQGYPS